MDESTTTTTPSSSHELDPTDWTYLAEGKLHVLLAYHGDHPRFQNHVLRLLKERHPGEEKAHYDPTHERDYVLRVVGPALGHQYLDAGVSLTVPPSFLAAIAVQIKPHRPARRAVYGLDLTACTVECLRDLTRFFPPSSLPPSSSSSSPCLTLELKPKAGYISRSRLVPPAHRFKYGESRFHLMQRYRYALHDTQALEPEWGELTGSPNEDYSPLDLFSEERERMTRALQGLLRNPQNFCQFFVGSQVVFGRGEGEVGRAREAARELLLVEDEEEEDEEKVTLTDCSQGEEEEGEEGEEKDWLDTLMVVVAQILEQEPLFRRLRRVQAMDVLDIEGAGMVMRRLIDLCGGEGDAGRGGGGEEGALALLELAELQGFLDGEREGGREGGVVATSTCAMVRRLEELLVVVHPSEKKNHDKSKPNDNDEDEDGNVDVKEEEVEGKAADRHHHHQSLDAQHAQATAAVQFFTKEECVVLLQRWLISLGACDCSIMLSLCRHDLTPSSLPSSSSGGHCQTSTSPGLVYYQPHRPNKMKRDADNGGTQNKNKPIKNKVNNNKLSNKCLPLSYFMHVVDLGPKPPSKILSKAAMEKEIIRVAGRGGGREGGRGV